MSVVESSPARSTGAPGQGAWFANAKPVKQSQKQFNSEQTLASDQGPAAQPNVTSTLRGPRPNNSAGPAPVPVPAPVPASYATSNLAATLGLRSIPERKLVVIGMAATGKTSLLTTFMTGEFDEKYLPTIFETTQTVVQVENLNVKVSLWDTAGK